MDERHSAVVAPRKAGGTTDNTSEGRAAGPHVCIVSLFAWPLFEPTSASVFGGSEVRIAAIAKGLAHRGRVQVSVVVWDHGQGAEVVRDGVRIVAWPDPAPTPISVEAPPSPPAAAPPSPFRLARLIRGWFEAGGSRRAVMFAPYYALLAARFALRIFLRAQRSARARAARARYRLRVRWRARARIGSYAVDRSRFELLDRLRPDVVVVHGATAVAAEIVSWAVSRGKASVYVAGSDIDFHPDYPAGKPTLYGDPGHVVSFAIAKATRHVVQTPEQARLLQEVYGFSSVVMRNPIDLRRRYERAEESGLVLWVGKSDAIKRPELAIEIARLIPEARFALVMNASDPVLYRDVESAARALGNVEIVQAIPFEQIESLFARASVFLSTSRFEGFPNTFLQAAKYGVPVASLAVDPGGMLTEHGAGILGNGNVDGLAAEISGLLRDTGRRRAMGDRALDYVRQHHDVDKALQALEGVIESAAVPQHGLR